MSSVLITSKLIAVFPSFTFKLPSFTLRFIFKIPSDPKLAAALTIFPPFPVIATSLLIFTFVVPVIAPTFTKLPVATACLSAFRFTVIFPPVAPILTKLAVVNNSTACFASIVTSPALAATSINFVPSATERSF